MVYHPSLLLAQQFSRLVQKQTKVTFYSPNYQSHVDGSYMPPLSRSTDSGRSSVLFYNFVLNCSISFSLNFATVLEKLYQKGTIRNLLNFLAKHILVNIYGRKMRLLNNTFANICTNILTANSIPNNLLCYYE